VVLIIGVAAGILAIATVSGDKKLHNVLPILVSKLSSP
jgi:hypothetical protein